MYQMFPKYTSPINVYHSRDKYNLSNDFISYFEVIDAGCDQFNKNFLQEITPVPKSKYEDMYPSVGYFKLNNTTIYSNYAISILSNDEMLLSPFCSLKSKNITVYDTLVVRSLFRWKITGFYSKIVNLSTEGQGGYYHWMFDILPKLQIIGKLFDDTYTIVLSFVRRNFIDESLIELGVKNYLYADNKFHIYAKETLVPELPSEIGNPRIESLIFLRERFLGSIKLANLQNKVYISRRYSSKRRVLNENELITLIKSYGFQVYYLENLSFTQQVDLFSTAMIVLSPHGAGLSNIVFMPKGSSVIELFPNNYYEECYQNISMKISLKHFLIIENNGNNNCDFNVNINRLDVSLSRLLK
jgi:hypothetical protein